MDKGIIEVRIKDSILNDTALEKDLIDAYPIKRAVIVPDLVENECRFFSRMSVLL